jgi:hypothetical protein
MKRKLIMSLICFIALIFLFPVPVHADMGPKPSVNIQFTGLEGQTYYVTLLAKQKSTGPFSYSTEPIDPQSYLAAGEHQAENLEAWQAFRDYQDEDGFYFLNFFRRMDSENSFSWTYYPPDTFKVLIYLPADHQFITTKILDKYAFDSYFKVSVSADMAQTDVTRSYNLSAELLSLFVRIILTLAVEMGIALLFQIRKKKALLFIFLVNVITQVSLNVLLSVINYHSGSVAYVINYALLELLVFAMEAAAYTIYFAKHNAELHLKKWVGPVYSLVSNAASFAAGMLISFFLPGIF